GAGGLIAVENVLGAPPDGHTLLFSTISTMVVIPATQAKPSYEPLRDFTAVTLIASVPYLLLAHGTLPVRGVPELVKLARAKPGMLTYGSAGHATGTHLAAEYFSATTGVQLTHVPYKGAGPAMIDMIAGQVALSSVTASSGQPHVLSGRARALGMMALTRLATLPAVPTVAEQGYPGFEAGSWVGLSVRAGTPAAAVKRLRDDAQRVMQMSELRAALEGQGNTVHGGSAEEFERYITAETAKWKGVIAKARIQIQ
ncbi:MAG: tripartite tricarboxylate transporter substrate binding protein, partial [Betaproteobacteria bacterium]|nr:tripartite tricarboxylate transporter substrate binding protein [Betaproteobacteria bacterium]